MLYTENSITQTPAGLYFSDAFMQQIADRCDALDRAGQAAEAQALLSEFDFWINNVG